MNLAASPQSLVRAYLDAMEARDLKLAQSFLAPGFSMEFPGPVRMSSLAQLLDWAKPRYRFVQKSYERYDVAGTLADGVVYCFGTLSGEWPDGTPFAGIRFIDRFALRDGLLADQKVWNDLGEALRERPAGTPTT